MGMPKCDECKKKIKEGLVGICPDCGKITCEECIGEEEGEEKRI